MVEITNCSVYDLPESIIASSYAMLTSQDEIDERVKNMRYWVSFGDFLPDFISHINTQGKNSGQDNPQSCYKCGSSEHVQRLKCSDGKMHYYCGKHCHTIYRYGEIKDHVVYTLIDNKNVRIDITGEKNITRTILLSQVDLPLVFGKNLQVTSVGYLNVDGVLFHILLKEYLGLDCDTLDHINRDKSNNTRENLRPSSFAQNIMNRGKQRSISLVNDVVGVSFRKNINSWRAYIVVDGVSRHLGYYKDKKDAIIARLKAEKDLFGAFSPNIDKFEEYGIEMPQITTLDIPDYDLSLAIKDFNRIVRLVNASRNSNDVKCHDNALTGIRVSFDMKYPNYFTPEFQRYHFADIVTSSSKMHRLAKMDMDACFNEYVSDESKAQMKKLLAEYNEHQSYDNYMRLLSNCPLGIELFMRVSTNYKQLQTIYFQRRHHFLREDWGAFCEMIESLPFAHQLIIGDKTTIDSAEFNREMTKL